MLIKNFVMYVASNQATTWYKMRHKFSPEHNMEHNRSKIRALHPIIISKNKRILGNIEA